MKWNKKITKSFISEYNVVTNLKGKIISDKIILDYDPKYKTSQKKPLRKIYMLDFSEK